MHDDLRPNAADFYDLNPDFPPHVPCYRNLIPSSTADILELGCGTGRAPSVWDHARRTLWGTSSVVGHRLRSGRRDEADLVPTESGNFNNAIAYQTSMKSLYS